MTIDIAFSELKHSEHSCNAVPIGVTNVAAYAMSRFENVINPMVFKKPEDLSDYLGRKRPKVVCFSSFLWNFNLSYQFADRIKKENPHTVVVFGGPHYPNDKEEQKLFLTRFPVIDFYIYREGEKAFANLLGHLIENDFDLNRLKDQRQPIPSCHYVVEGDAIIGDLEKRIDNLDTIPSPYLSGLCDGHLKDGLVPVMQTARGCPFSCTYCQEGDSYYSKVSRYPLDRIREELEYIAQRSSSPNLLFADSNLGMYKEDVEVFKIIRDVQNKFHWPDYVIDVAGKNSKARVLECARLIKGAYISAAVQSTDKSVLECIKRDNVSLEQMVDVATQGREYNSNTVSEVILCLPGDTKEAHFKSICDLIEANIKVVRSHQFIMLPGSEAASPESRNFYRMETRFRVVPKTVSSYELYNESFRAPEIDEICVGNNSMPFEDYVECRLFNLTVEIFYNNSIFYELLVLLKRFNISISEYIKAIHEKLSDPGSGFEKMVQGFKKDTNELWSSEAELEAFLQQPENIEKFVNGEMGNNEQLTYQAVAVFTYMDRCHNVAFEAAGQMLENKEHWNDQYRLYLKELSEFSRNRKNDMLHQDRVIENEFSFDFVALAQIGFNVDPLEFYRKDGVMISFLHGQDQKEHIKKYTDVYGTSNYGLGNILSFSSADRLYRQIGYAEAAIGAS